MKKKVILRAAIFISVLLLIFQGVLAYRDYASYKGVLHQEVDNIVKIHVDAIGKSMFYNAIKHPIYYYGRYTKDRDTLDDKTSGKGFGLPAHLFIYTIKGKKRSTLFSSFRISDAEDFEVYLKEQQFSDFQELNTLQIASRNNGKIMVAFSHKQCVVVYNPTHENVNDIFTDLLLEDKTLEDTEEIYKKLKNAAAHINYISLTNRLGINFKNGKAVFSGAIALASDFEVPAETDYPKFSEESSVQFFMNLKSSRSFEAIAIHDITIAPDSISPYYNGHLMLELAGTTQQKDTVVTYEYNDDFEKVGVKTFGIKDVPEINLILSAAPKNLLDYFKNASIVTGDKLNDKIFPLYQFKVDTTPNNFELSTNLSKAIASPQVTNNGVFGLEIDFEKLKAQNHFPILQDYLNEGRDLKLKGQLHNKNTIAIEGHLQLKLEDIHAMTQFIF